MQNDRQIFISTATNRRSVSWTDQSLRLSEFYNKLKTPVKSPESYEAYTRLTKAKQDDLKDVGGFVGGKLEGKRRKANAVITRELITLDIDNVKPGETENVLNRVCSLGCGYCIYSTRKHQPYSPRFRVILPLNKPVEADKYEPIARKVAEKIDPEMAMFDPSTFEASRLMYWPSCCSDSEYVYRFEDRPFVDGEKTLDEYDDWKDISGWPQVPGTAKTFKRKVLERQANPTEKGGIIGAFCKAYNVFEAIEKLLPDTYSICADSTDRLTYLGGSTTGGAIVYENGLFVFSHHATDPAGGALCNAFDLVRLHKFGDLDVEAKEGTPHNRLPSYMSMTEFARSDDSVMDILNRERYEKAVSDFDIPDEKPDLSWMRKLKSSETGRYEKTIDNVQTLMENDPNLKGRIRLNLFTRCVCGVCPLPWGRRKNETNYFQWEDKDYSGLYGYIEKVLGFRSRDAIESAFQIVSDINSFHPIKDYLDSCEWDGTDRLDTLYIDYFGAIDNPYTRAIARKAFCAAVARVIEPGTKFDNMTVLCGGQGIGKTTFFQKLGGEWFSNSVGTFEGKDAAELIQKAWIVEIGELEAFSKTDIKIVKQFLSKCDDQYRAAYGRTVEKRARQCVFFGTTNDPDYLKDQTGNRRFWPVDAHPEHVSKSVFDDLDQSEIRQIWGEAVYRLEHGESLILDKDLEVEAEKMRNDHMEQDVMAGQIIEFLRKPVPVDWLDWNYSRRMMFWNGECKGSIELVERDRVCALEISRECLGDRRPSIPRQEALRLNNILRSLDGWKATRAILFGKDYGRQRGFVNMGNIK